MYRELKEKLLALGAAKAEELPVSEFCFDASFRRLCEQNSCGMYGKNWQCPPHCGDIEDLITRLRGYSSAIVYQTVDALEDSFDFEGMMAAGARMAALTAKLAATLQGKDVLLLGAGACRICEKCAILEDRPCRFPDKAVCSLEACGVDVSALARAAGMSYTNGKDTVTYFGAVLFK